MGVGIETLTQRSGRGEFETVILRFEFAEIIVVCESTGIQVYASRPGTRETVETVRWPVSSFADGPADDPMQVGQAVVLNGCNVSGPTREIWAGSVGVVTNVGDPYPTVVFGTEEVDVPPRYLLRIKRHVAVVTYSAHKIELGTEDAKELMVVLPAVFDDAEDAVAAAFTKAAMVAWVDHVFQWQWVEEWLDARYVTCLECDRQLRLEDSVSTYCGSVCVDCLSEHACACEVCALDIRERLTYA